MHSAIVLVNHCKQTGKEILLRLKEEESNSLTCVSMACYAG